MKTGTILDTDMTTLWRMLRQGLQWWLDELEAMIPGAGPRSDRPISGTVVSYGSDGRFRLDGEILPLADDPGQKLLPATIVISDQLCLIRKTALPAMRLPDLRKLVMLDLDRLMPFPADSAYADACPTGHGSGNGQVEVEIAALPKAQLHSICAAATAAGLTPRAIGLTDEDGRQLRFDFLPGLVADGSVAQPRTGRAFWWWLVALLFLVNIVVMVVRDVHKTSQLAALVESQQPAAAAVRRLSQSLSTDERVRAELLARRKSDDALAALAFVTRAVPSGAWIQRYSWNGSTLRLAGYKRDNVDVVAALRKSGAFAAVRASASDVAAESLTGQPFDVTAEWQRGARR